MSYIDVAFPIQLSRDTVGGPAYMTDVTPLDSGHEQRNQRWSRERHQYDLSVLLLTAAQMDELTAHFRRMKGRAYSFPFSDPTDNTASVQALGTGTGALTTFQLRKGYTSGGVTDWRTITKPKSGTVKVFLDGVEQGSGWSVAALTGVVTFTSAPGSGVVVAASFSFYVPVRYDTDTLRRQIVDSDGVNKFYAPQSLTATEVRV